MNCKTSTDLLNTYLNVKDYPKVKHLIDGITEITEELVNITSTFFLHIMQSLIM